MRTKIFILLVCLSAAVNAQRVVLNAKTCAGFWSRKIGWSECDNTPFEMDTISSLIFDGENQSITVNGITYYDPLSEEEMFEKYGILVRNGSLLRCIDDKYKMFYCMDKILFAVSKAKSQYHRNNLEHICTMLSDEGVLHITADELQSFIDESPGNFNEILKLLFDNGIYTGTAENFADFIGYNIKGFNVIEIILKVGDFNGLTSVIIHKHYYYGIRQTIYRYNKDCGWFGTVRDDDGNSIPTEEEYPVYGRFLNNGMEYLIKQYLY